MNKKLNLIVLSLLIIFAVSCQNGAARNGGYLFVRYLTEVERPCSISTVFQVNNTFNLPVPDLELRNFSIKENWDDVDKDASGMVLKTKADFDYTQKIVLVIDNSNSYSESKWEGMKEQIKNFIDGMFEEQQIAIISYALTSELIMPFKTSSPEDKVELKKAIDDLSMLALDSSDVLEYIEKEGRTVTAQEAASRNNLRDAMRLASSLYNDIYSTSKVEQGFIFLFTDGGHGAYESKLFYDARIADDQWEISAANETMASKMMWNLRWDVPSDIDGRNVVVFNMEAPVLETYLLTGIASRWYEYCAGSHFLGLRLNYHAKLLERHSRSMYILSYNTDRRFDPTKEQNTYKLTIRFRGNGHVLGNYKLLYDFDTQELFNLPENEIIISGITGNKMGLDFNCDDFERNFDSADFAASFTGKEYKRHIDLLIHPEGKRTVFIETPGKSNAEFIVTSSDNAVVALSSSSGSDWSSFLVEAKGQVGDFCTIHIKDKNNPEYTRDIPVTIVEIAGNFIEVQPGSFRIGGNLDGLEEYIEKDENGNALKTKDGKIVYKSRDGEDEYAQERFEYVDSDEYTEEEKAQYRNFNGKRVGEPFLPVVKIERAYYICDLEVSQKLWFEVMLNRPSAFKDDSTTENYVTSMNRPVENISWNEAISFCNNLSRIAGLEEVYTGNGRFVKADFSKNGYRLPTEAEWEYAARGGHNPPLVRTDYPGTDKSAITDFVWMKDNAMDSTHRGGEKAANELGLYDMSGNVWEWCWDWYYRDQYYTYKDGVKDPEGPTELLSENFKDDLGDGNGRRSFNPNEDRRVIRGGSVFYYSDKVTISNRNSGTVGSKNQGTGLRLVRTKTN